MWVRLSPLTERSVVLVYGFQAPQQPHSRNRKPGSVLKRVSPQEGSIWPQNDGARTYFTRTELERYVHSCDSRATPYLT